MILTTLIREEFTRHGLTDTITLTHRNVCKDGFTVVDTADSGEFLRSDKVVKVMLTYSQSSWIYRHPGRLLNTQNRLCV